jgi:hypothetical protein
MWFVAVDDLEVTYHLFDRHRAEVQQRLDRSSDLLVLLGDATEEATSDELLVGGCCMGKRLPQMSYCSSVQERRGGQGQPTFLLPTEDRGRHGKGMSRRCLGCRIERL